MREDPVKKFGYKLPSAVIKKMNKRQVMVKKGISNPPVSMLSDSVMEWKSPVAIHTINFGKTPKKPDGNRYEKDMIRYAKPDVVYSTRHYRGSVSPMLETEKVGGAWGRLSLPTIGRRR
jgi:hypothetical protein